MFITVGVVLTQPSYFTSHIKLSAPLFQMLMAMDNGFYSYIILTFTTLPLTVLILEYMIPKTEEIVMIRSSSYFGYAFSHLKLIIINAMISLLIYVGVASVIMIASFGIGGLIENGFIQVTLHEIISLFLFYIWGSLFYLIIRRLTNKKMAALIILIVFMVVQIAILYALPSINRLIIPIENVTSYGSIFQHTYGAEALIYLDLRDLFFCIFLFVTYFMILDRKDVLSFEIEDK